jgi:hypothetical protein
MNNNDFELTQRTNEEWAESHTAVYAVQMVTLNYLSWNTKKKFPSIKQDPKHE